MHIFVVIWLVVNQTVTTPLITPDDYTGQWPNCSTLGLTYKSETRLFTKVFKTEPEAKQFIQNAPEFLKPRMKIVELQEINE